MKSPGSWKKQWCQTTVSDLKKGAAADDGIDGSVPLIKLEAMFAPSGDGLTKSTTSDHELSEPAEPVEKEEGDSASTPNVTSDEEVDSHIMLQGTAQLPTDPFQTHMLRVASFWIPATCGVCSTVMLGRNQGFQCEECSIQCCSDCRLHVDLQIPCGSEAARLTAQRTLHNKISVKNILSIVAPDDAFTQNKHGTSRSDGYDGSQQEPSSEENDEETAGIGCFRLDFVKACVFERPLPADSGPNFVYESKLSRALRIGDYYARVSVSGSPKTARTRTLQNTGMPNFGSSEMTFDV
jgi:hypothetical protein